MPSRNTKTQPDAAQLFDKKRCSACNADKPLADFSRSKQTKSGYCSRCKECSNRTVMQWMEDNAERVQAYHKARYQRKRQEIINKSSKQYKSIMADPERAERRRNLAAAWARNHRSPETRQRQKETRAKIKLEIISHYSDGTIRCACCGVGYIEFLAIDHINGNGGQHRRDVRNLYSWLRRNNFPEGFRVLCHNCNFAVGHYDHTCPHERIKV